MTTPPAHDLATWQTASEDHTVPDDQDGQQTDIAAREQLERRRLARLIEALPIFSGLLSVDGQLMETHPQTREAFLWDLPSFAYDHDSITQIVDLCERAAAGERVQIERPYRRSTTTAADQFGRGLLTLTPVRDEGDHIEELTVTLIDCDDNGLGLRDGQVRNRLATTNLRIENMLSLAQTVIEASADDIPTRQSRDQLRDRLTLRLDALASVIDIISDPERQDWPLQALIRMLCEDLPDALQQGRLQLNEIDGDIAIEHVPLMTLLLFELVSNARRFGAWRDDGKGRAGTVSIQSDVVDDHDGRTLRLHWTEDGGPPVPADLGRRFGFTLAERLFPQITGGTARLLNAEDGLSWTFELPVRALDVPLASDFGFDGYPT